MSGTPKFKGMRKVVPEREPESGREKRGRRNTGDADAAGMASRAQNAPPLSLTPGLCSALS